jgi:hypothetical protein
MTRLEKYGIPATLALNLLCRLIAGRHTAVDFNPSSLLVLAGGAVIAGLAVTVLFMEHRRPPARTWP